MSYIICKNVSLAYPIYDVDARSLKRGLVNIATGGRFSTEARGNIQVNALHDINFHLKKGDRLGLIGHNGAGKSTLLRVLSGVYEPIKGQVLVKGNISSLINVNVGMQPTLTGYENIRLRSLILGLSNEQIAYIIKDIEEFTELGNFLSMPVKTYSSGMTLRLAFGLSTAIIPDILLVDEVIGTGDAGFIQKAKNRMLSFINQSNIMVISSHDNAIIKQFCTKVLWLEHGHVKMFGALDDVMEVFEGTTAIDFA
ncbi:MAG: ABC transporter ATP-binding protein [Legionella sp.]|nr:ABC transporter ATP-binding protein [Legionella sp.]